jgi:hypothetical protein
MKDQWILPANVVFKNGRVRIEFISEFDKYGKYVDFFVKAYIEVGKNLKHYVLKELQK